MKLLLIPKGEFTMGSPPDPSDSNGVLRAGNQHKETIAQPFYMGVYSVTQAQWKAIMGMPPPTKRMSQRPVGEIMSGDNYPATNVMYDDAVDFCRRASADRTHRPPPD